MFRRRPGRPLLWLMLATYALYWFCLEEFVLIYFYLLDTFDGYEGADFSVFLFIVYVEGAFSSLVLIPIINGTFKVCTVPSQALTITIMYCIIVRSTSL